mgnify:CR=1 FL=1
MQALAKIKHIRVTPMKARRVVNLIRGKQASEALAILKFAPQAASEPIYKLVHAAMANAKVKADKANLAFDEDDLIVSQAFVDEGTTLAALLEGLPTVDPAAAITVWGQRAAPDYILRGGDRIEILRPLLADPNRMKATMASVMLVSPRSQLPKAASITRSFIFCCRSEGFSL